MANTTGAPPVNPPASPATGGWVARQYLVDHLVRLLCGPEYRFRAHVHVIDGHVMKGGEPPLSDDQLDEIFAIGPHHLSDGQLAALLFNDARGLARLRLLLDVAGTELPEVWMTACIVSCNLEATDPGTKP